MCACIGSHYNDIECHHPSICGAGDDPDELEVYGTDTTTGPLLTSYKFEVVHVHVNQPLGLSPPLSIYIYSSVGNVYS